MPAADGSQMLVLLLDITAFVPAAQPLPEEQESNATLPPDSLLKQIMVFINAYLLASEMNELCVMAMAHDNCPVLHMSTHDTPDARAPAAAIKGRLEQMLRLMANTGVRLSDVALAGGISRALTIINRHEQQQHSARRRARHRLLVLQASRDGPGQYIPVMNAIFAAQKSEVCIDSVILHSHPASYLQQAAAITRGLCLRPQVKAALLQYLLSVFVADSETRRLLQLPSSAAVDFKASCFCHKKPIDMGFVCSVCLSIFCQPASECSTCATKFG